jgi:hypothetical protein
VAKEGGTRGGRTGRPASSDRSSGTDAVAARDAAVGRWLTEALPGPSPCGGQVALTVSRCLLSL